MIQGRRKANIGRRQSEGFDIFKISEQEIDPFPSPIDDLSESTRNPISTALIRSDGRHVTIACPELVVVAGYLHGAGVYKMLEDAGITIQSVTVNWGRDVLQAIDSGKLDIAIYNKQETTAYLEEHPDSTLKVIGNIGASMAGKNFAITVAANSDLIDTPLSELPAKLKGRQLFVGKTTDRYRNILSALKMTDEQLLATGVNIIDFPDPPLSIIKDNPMALLVCGQNARMAAQIDDSFVEILNYDCIAPEDKQLFYEASENCLIASERLSNMLVVPFKELMKHFAGNLFELQFNQELLGKLIEFLKLYCFTFSENEIFDCDKLARQILFETYHVGSRQW